MVVWWCRIMTAGNRCGSYILVMPSGHVQSIWCKFKGPGTCAVAISVPALKLRVPLFPFFLSCRFCHDTVLYPRWYFSLLHTLFNMFSANVSLGAPVNWTLPLEKIDLSHTISLFFSILRTISRADGNNFGLYWQFTLDITTIVKPLQSAESRTTCWRDFYNVSSNMRKGFPTKCWDAWCKLISQPTSTLAMTFFSLIKTPPVRKMSVNLEETVWINYRRISKFVAQLT